MIRNLFDEWKKSSALKYESIFHAPIVEAFCQWHSATDKGRDAKGRIFNAGYEAFIYAFFVGLYRNERRPLAGQTRSFSMEVFRLGDVNDRNTGRKKYTEIQQSIFAALIAKTDLDLVDYDRGNITPEDAVVMLMTTMNEIANAGFYAINEKMKQQEDFFTVSENILDFVIAK